MNRVNKKNKHPRLKEMILSFLYLFVLLVTTFHHHPIDFGRSESQLKTIPTATNHYNFSAEECPIINFSQKDFYTIFATRTSTKLTFNLLHQTALSDNKVLKNIFSYSYSLRGPPSPIFS